MPKDDDAARSGYVDRLAPGVVVAATPGVPAPGHWWSGSLRIVFAMPLVVALVLVVRCLRVPGARPAAGLQRSVAR